MGEINMYTILKNFNQYMGGGGCLIEIVNQQHQQQCMPTVTDVFSQTNNKVSSKTRRMIVGTEHLTMLQSMILPREIQTIIIKYYKASGLKTKND